jgi:hypothetical protein
VQVPTPRKDNAPLVEFTAQTDPVVEAKEMEPESPGVPVASTESDAVLVRALVGVGEVKLTMSGVVMSLVARVTAPVARARP